MRLVESDRAWSRRRLKEILPDRAHTVGHARDPTGSTVRGEVGHHGSLRANDRPNERRCQDDARDQVASDIFQSGSVCEKAMSHIFPSEERARQAAANPIELIEPAKQTTADFRNFRPPTARFRHVPPAARATPFSHIPPKGKAKER